MDEFLRRLDLEEVRMKRNNGLLLTKKVYVAAHKTVGAGSHQYQKG